MFERFTDSSRRVVVLAQEEARLLKHGYIGTEHILLGLIHESGSVAAKVLESLSISLDAVRSQVEDIVGQGNLAPVGHIPFTPRAKKVLELSLRESLQLGHNYIGPEHILLGLVREGDGVAARMLANLGANALSVQNQTTQLLAGNAHGSGTSVEAEVPGGAGAGSDQGTSPSPDARVPAGGTVTSGARRIFLSYRRNGAAADTGRLYDALVAEFGVDRLFKDVDDVPIGENFAEEIRAAISASFVVIVVIHPDWHLGTGDDGRPDFVRLELEMATDAGVPLLPVLVRGARVPDRSELPEWLQGLALIHAATLDDRTWGSDVQKLIGAITRKDQARTANGPGQSDLSKDLVYDLRFPEDDGEVYFILKVEPTIHDSFKAVLSTPQVIDLRDYGEILYSGRGEPSNDIKEEMRTKYGMYEDA